MSDVSIPDGLLPDQPETVGEFPCPGCGDETNPHMLHQHRFLKPDDFDDRGHHSLLEGLDRGREEIWHAKCAYEAAPALVPAEALICWNCKGKGEYAPEGYAEENIRVCNSCLGIFESDTTEKEFREEMKRRQESADE